MPSLKVVHAVAHALALSEYGVNPNNPPTYPHDYSKSEQLGYMVQAHAAIAAYQDAMIREIV